MAKDHSPYPDAPYVMEFHFVGQEDDAKAMLDFLHDMAVSNPIKGLKLEKTELEVRYPIRHFD